MSASPQRQLPHAPSVSLNGRQVPYVTVENPRRKSISIYWTGRIEVRCPPGTTKRRVEAVLREHADWVLAHLPAEGVPASRYCDGGVIPYRGGRAVLGPWSGALCHHEGGRSYGGLAQGAQRG